MLFCTFHPDEYATSGEYITKIQLQKDVSLFFMIDNIYKTFIISALISLLNNPIGYLETRNYDKLIYFINKIKEEKFDGWFSSIDKKIRLEVALINNKNIFKKIDENIKFINNKNFNLNRIYPLDNKYLICSLENPLIININTRYKKIIQDYIDLGIKKKYIDKIDFQIILQNAIISYHEHNYESKINW
jgi:hypothetical protein